MLTLALLRHAKSSWDDPGVDDFHRSLNARGLAAAPLIGRWLARHAPPPEAVLCSTATRTRATLALVLPEVAAAAPHIHYSDELYLASAPQILEQVRAVGTNARALMVVGHNPGLQMLAVALAGHGRREQLGALRNKLPTAGLAILAFPADSFADIGSGEGTLVDFVSPRRLA